MSEDDEKNSLVEELIYLRQRVADLELELEQRNCAPDRDNAPDAVRQSEQTIRALLNATPEVALLINSRGIVLAANEGVARSLGTTVKELVGSRLYGFFPAQVSETRKARVEETVRTGKPVHFVDQRKGLYFENYFYPVLGPRGDVAEVAIFAQDITERKKTEESLLRSEERFRKYFNTSMLGIAITSPEMRWIEVNDKLCDILGYTREELGNVTWADLTPEEDLETELKLYGKALSAQYRGSLLEKRYRRRDGTLIDVEISAAPVFKSDGTLDYLISLVQDITARKKLENQVLHAHKMEAIGTLAGGIAHDFNNLLMGIQGYVSLMLYDIDSPQNHREKLKNMEDLVKSGAGLTRQILGFARGGRFEVKSINVNELLGTTAEVFARTTKDVVVHQRFQEDPYTVEADQGQLEQVFLNLFVNAWHAMPGGGDLYVSTENVRIDEDYAKVYLAKPGNYLKISITDSGVGMDEKTKERIFEPFFTTREMGRGSGLGLATAYGIVKGHNGIIDVISEKGGGSTFIILLPASEKRPAEKKKDPNQVARGTETILLVDDEERVVEVNKALLEMIGYTVFTAYSGREAVEVYKSRGASIDLVVLDMIMPDMGGEATFKTLRKIDPEAKVMLSSGYALDGQAAEIMSLGCLGFLQKPFNLAELSDKIREILDGSD